MFGPNFSSVSQFQLVELDTSSNCRVKFNLVKNKHKKIICRPVADPYASQTLNFDFY